MQIRSEIDSKYQNIEIHVCKDEMDDNVRSIMAKLHMLFDAEISATDENGNRRMLRPADVISFYAEGQRVMAMDEGGRYTVAKKLYELEEELENLCFVRISKSEIVNYKKIKGLDMSLTGTIKVIMKNGYETYTSRRNVPKIKELLLKQKKQ